MELSKVQIIYLAVFSFVAGVLFLAWQIETMITLDDQLTRIESNCIDAECSNHHGKLKVKDGSGLQETYNPQPAAKMTQQELPSSLK